MTMKRSLLLGCGNSREKKFYPNDAPNWAGELTALDMNPDCGADVVWDLDVRPLPFADDTFDEMGAFDVLEHLGRQGDWKGYFDEFAEYWRILKPGGLFSVIVPVGDEVYADPGHTRFFSLNWFLFLSQQFYAEKIAKGEQFTDYRWYWKKNFSVIAAQDLGGHHLAVMLRKE